MDSVLNESSSWSGSGVICQNTVNQSDCSILKSAPSEEKIHESTFEAAAIDSRNVKDGL